MNYYAYNLTIFDNRNSFEKTLYQCAYAESRNEAQRQIVDKLFSKEGFCGQCITPNDSFSSDRFHIVFDNDPLIEEEVIWNDELERWDWAIPH